MPDDYPPHADSPLRRQKQKNYFAHCRNDVIETLGEHHVAAKRVLELGCSAGGTGAKLKGVLATELYVGIERDEDAAAIARGQLDQVHVADLNSATPKDLGLHEQRFDLLLALDVLEHLYDPWDVMARWSALVVPGGYIAISVPNIQNTNIVQDLLNGTFTYADEGLLDATHIRFFTRKTMIQLLTGAGLVDVIVQPLVWEMAPSFDKLPAQNNKLNMGRIAFVGLSREEVVEWLTYQYIAIARRPA